MSIVYKAFAGDHRAMDAAPSTPFETAGLGLIAPYDFALDAELWRWAPADVTLYLTRTHAQQVPVGVDQALELADIGEIADLARDLATPGPAATALLCTSASFVRGRVGERELVQAMQQGGAPVAVTTSGALLEGAAALGITRLAVATPYPEPVTALLVDFLAEAGIAVPAATSLGLEDRIWQVPYATTAQNVRAAVRAADRIDGVFISCTNVRSYDLVGPLEQELQIPVLTANLVTMWATLRAIGRAAVGAGSLCTTP